MSHEPSSSAHLAAQFRPLGSTHDDGLIQRRAEPRPARPKPGKGKKVRVRVEGAERRAMNKWATTTEQLTAEERQIIAGYRLSSDPNYDPHAGMPKGKR